MTYDMLPGIIMGLNWDYMNSTLWIVRVILYICVTEGNYWHQNVLFTPAGRLIMEENSLKNNCLFMSIMRKSIRILAKFRCYVSIPHIDQNFFPPTIDTFAHFKFNNWTHFTNPFYYFCHESYEHLLHHFNFIFFYWIHFNLTARFTTYLIKLM